MHFLLTRPSRFRLILAAILGLLALFVYFGSATCPRCTEASMAAGTCHCWYFIPGPIWLVALGLVAGSYVIAAAFEAVRRRGRGAHAA